MSLQGGPKAMLLGVHLTLLAILLDGLLFTSGQVALGAFGTWLVVAGYRFDWPDAQIYATYVRNTLFTDCRSSG